LQKALVELASAGLLDSAHDCSEGGIAVTLAESAFGRGVGCSVDIASHGLPAECALFGEDASRVVISGSRENLPRIQKVALQYGLSTEVLGETTSQHLEIKLEGAVVVSAGVGELREIYDGALESALT